MFPLVPAAKIPAAVATIEPLPNSHVPEEILVGEVTKLVTGVPLAKIATRLNAGAKLTTAQIDRISPPSDNTVISRGAPPRVPTEATPSASNDVSRTPTVLILNALSAYDAELFTTVRI